HVLWTGDHGLVNIDSGDVAQRGSELALGQRATGAGNVVAHGAVDADELAADRGIPVALKVTLVRNAGSGPARSDIGGERGDLLGSELNWLGFALRAGRRERHATGADLEVDGSRSDTDQAWTLCRALQRHT